MLDTGERPHEAVRDCKGDILLENGNPSKWTDEAGVERGMCWLHPYRFGKNPYRPKRPATPAQKAWGERARHK